MNQPTEPTDNGPMSYAWLGLLVGFGLIALVVWQNSGSGLPNRNHGGNPLVIDLTDASFQTEVAESKVPVVIDFWASWCGPCLQFAPTMDKLATTYAGRVKFCKVNVDDEKALARTFKVSGIPAIFIFKNGQRAIQPIEGAISEEDLTRIIEKVLQSS